MKELRISALQNGTVIDHIPVQDVFRIIDILRLQDLKKEISIATNLPSKKLGRKGIIKVSNVYLDQSAVDAIALLAAGTNIAIIENYKVAKKIVIKTPKSVSGIVKCFNPNCITNNEEVTTKFVVVDSQPLKLQCHFCSKIMNEDNLRFKSV